MIKLLEQQILELKLKYPYHPDIRVLQMEMDKLIDEQIKKVYRVSTPRTTKKGN